MVYQKKIRVCIDEKWRTFVFLMSQKNVFNSWISENFFAKIVKSDRPKRRRGEGVRRASIIHNIYYA
tara:strand:+ start:5546 stop:5746 length:201 start_codon:yes stop_codon:yes gene_type:complete